MTDTVFFSLIGKSDPTRGNYDGPFLHILRHYRPKKAYIFLTKEIYEYHKKDNRFVVLGNRVCPECQIMVLDYSHFDKPFDFILADKYIREAYQKVCNENPDSNILINITSSTTQMTSALYLLAATETERCLTLIQVLTPEKAGNITKPVGIDYDIEYEWNNLLDNLIDDTDIENRCLNITPDNARYHLACESIKSHMMHYDYNAALAIAKYTRHLFDKRVLKLLEAGVIRSSLFFSEAKTLAAEAGYSFITVESSDANEIFEYILYMKIKKERKELTEFSRAISPLLTGLFTAYLENVHKVDIKKFCNMFAI
jgi:CRISPR type III-A/MTUBE-associated protein Csm6